MVFCVDCPPHTLTGIIAGVREGVGNEGLQRLMGEKSEAVTSRVGGLICRTFGGLRVFPELWVPPPTEDELVSASATLACWGGAPLASAWRTEDRGQRTHHPQHQTWRP